MQLTTTRAPTALQTVRQSGIMRTPAHGGQNLVFVYPFVCDESLRKYSSLLRDFLTVDIMSQIKVSNVLNITSSSSRIGMVGTGKNAVNPAQEVRRSLWNVGGIGNQTPNFIDDDRYERAEHQEHVANFTRFITDQIQNNPRYSILRPVISSLVIENLITIPLIVGTKEFPIKPTILYWILLASIATGTRLDRPSSLNALKPVIRAMPPENYIDFVFSNRTRNELLASSGISRTNRSDRDLPHNDMQIDRYINDSVDQAIGTLVKIVNPNFWASETGNIETRSGLTLDNVPRIQTATQKRTYDAAIASFNIYIGNLVPGLIFDLESLLGPFPTNIDMPAKTDQLLSQFSTIGNNGMDLLSSNIVTSLQNINITAGAGVEKAVKKLKDIQSMCEENSDIGENVGRILEDLNKNQLTVVTRPSQYRQFFKAFNNAAQAFSVNSKTYERWLMDIVDDASQTVLVTALKAIFDQIKLEISNFIMREYPAGNPHLFSPIPPAIPPPPLSDPVYGGRYANIVTIQPGMELAELSVIVNDFIEGMTNIIYFLFLYNFFSYTCIFMRDIDVDIETQRRDALEFPNYCLIVPLEIIKALYAIQKARMFRQLIHLQAGNVADVDIPTNVDDMNIGWSNIKRIIELISRQLGVPNIIVVDEGKKSIYYKFMFMDVVNKLNISSLESYVRHQQDILPGF